MHAKSVQLCLTFSDPTNCSPSDSSGGGILQVKILEWGLPCPSPGYLPNPGMKTVSLMSPAWAEGSLMPP